MPDVSHSLTDHIDDNIVLALADALDASPRDVRIAADASAVEHGVAVGAVSQFGASLLLCLGSLSTHGHVARSDTHQISEMPFQLEHGENAKTNWVGRRERGRPAMDTFGRQVAWFLDRLASEEGVAADLAIGWGAEGRRYGEISLPSERTAFLYSTHTLVGDLHPGIVRLTNIEVDWMHKLQIPAYRLVRFARRIAQLPFAATTPRVP
jgi:hypothetical protein